MKTQPAVAYVRVSGKGQLDGDGFRRQLESVRNYAKTNGFNIEHEFEERGISGTTELDQRPAFGQMIEILLSNGCRTIIVEGLDRLARRLQVQELLVIYLASKGLTLISANTGENVTEAMHDDPMRRAMIQMQGVFSELEKNLLVRKLRKARDRTRADNGRCEGRKPFGHRPGELKTLEKMRTLRGEGLSYEKIASMLDSEKLPPRSGRPWNPVVVNRILRASARKN